MRLANEILLLVASLFLVLVKCSPTYQTPAITDYDENGEVQTKYGKVRGRVSFSRSGKPFYAFNGIPYAKPPIGERRFKPPEPPAVWNGTLDATADGPMCIQTNYLLHEVPPVEGKEDCLYMNVYTPQINNYFESTQWYTTEKPTLPVMVFIHYGAFFAGTGNSDYLGPEYFMDKNVILVTFNYRLGIFGFLSTNDDASPGNYGLKDQVAALKFVNENIEAFGGDAGSVTIFGQSAGAGCVHYHLLSPTTQGLFQAAISQSGSTLSLWARPQNDLQAAVARQQASFVGCNATSDTHTIIKCLRNVDANVLAKSIQNFKSFSSEPFLIYAPVTEKVTRQNPNPYITEDPLVLIKSGNFHRVPWIVGVVEDEGILRASPLLRQPKVKDILVEKFNEIGPQIFGVQFSVPPNKVKDTWRNITKFFFGSDSFNITETEDVQGFIDLYSDRSFMYGSYQSALLHAWRGHTPIWFYNFAYKGAQSYGKHFATTEKDIGFKWGVSHCDDLLYLFPSKKLFWPLDKTDTFMSHIMIDLWTSFATFGNPTPFLDLPTFSWDSLPNLENKSSVKNSDLVFLNISGPYKAEEGPPVQLYMHNEFYKKRMHFWESLPLHENIEGIE